MSYDHPTTTCPPSRESKALPNAPRNNAMKDTLFGRGDFWGIGSYLVPHPGTPATRTNHDQPAGVSMARAFSDHNITIQLSEMSESFTIMSLRFTQIVDPYDI